MQERFLKTTTICLTALVLAACGGSGSGAAPGGTGGDDGGGGSDSGGNAGSDGKGGMGGATESGDPRIDVSTEVGAPGLASTATATSEDGATFTWELTKQPEGSDLADEDLEDSDTATVRFIPQVEGAYELSVTATSNGESSTKEVTLEVEGYDVPFALFRLVPGEEESNVHHVALMVSSGGGDAREVGCTHTVTAGYLGQSGSPIARAYATATYVPQTLKEEARIASFVFDKNSEVDAKVELATSKTQCADEEAGDAPVFADLGEPVTEPALPLRFSPNGSRLLGMSQPAAQQLRLLTADSSSGELRALVVGDPSWIPHYGWSSDGRVFVQHQDAQHPDSPYQLLLIADEEDSLDDGSLVVDCTGVDPENAVMPINQVYPAGDDLVVVKDYDVYRLEADDEGKFDCAIDSERNALVAEDVNSVDVARDGSRIVYDSTAENGIFVSPLASLEDAVRISPEDGTQHFHPRFALGGAQVVWTSVYQYSAPEDDETTPFDEDVVRVYRANPDGSHPFVVWQRSGPEEETLFATGGTQRAGCSFALPFGAGSPALLALAAAGLVALRRRRPR